MTVGEEYEKAIIDGLRKQVQQVMDNAARDRVREALDSWISFTAQKKPVPDLDKRLENFRKRIEALATSMTLDIGDEGYVVKASGDAEATLQMLERGTGWFNPAGNLTEMIVGAIFEQRS